MLETLILLIPAKQPSKSKVEIHKKDSEINENLVVLGRNEMETMFVPYCTPIC
jgi:hypothetical protein